MDKVILAEGICLKDDEIGRTRPNDNEIIIGATGTGKTMSVFMPTVLNTNNKSLVVSLSKRAEAWDLVDYMRRKGYLTYVCDLVDPDCSTGIIDPLQMTTSYLDVVNLSKQIVLADPDSKNVKDIYWIDGAISLLNALMLVAMMVIDNATMADVLDLFDALVIEEDGKRIGVVPQDAITAVVSAVPKGCVVTKSRAKDFLVIVYTLYYGNIPFDTEKNWEGYRLNDTDYGYSLNHHRLVSDEGEINGNGMSWRYRGKTWNRRRDAETLSHEGIPTFEANYRCYVDSLEKWEYDFDDLFVVVEKERNNYSDDEDEDLTG